MSVYYDYFLGYQKEDNKIYPLGIYDCFNKIHPVYSHTRSMGNGLYDYFWDLPKEKCSIELKEALGLNLDEDESFGQLGVRYLTLDEMSDGNFLNTGYYLIEDIKRFLKNKDIYELGEYLTNDEYLMKLENEIKFGEVYNDKDEEEYIYNCRDYHQFSYIDYNSENYISHIIRSIAEQYEYVDCISKNKYKMVVVLLIG